jgi:hypothetical protein
VKKSETKTDKTEPVKQNPTNEAEQTNADIKKEVEAKNTVEIPKEEVKNTQTQKTEQPKKEAEKPKEEVKRPETKKSEQQNKEEKISTEPNPANNSRRYVNLTKELESINDTKQVDNTYFKDVENITSTNDKSTYEQEKKNRQEWEEKIANFTATDILTLKLETYGKEVK